MLTNKYQQKQTIFTIEVVNKIVLIQKLWVSKTAKMLLQRKSFGFVAPSGEKYLIFMLLKVCKWTVISPTKNIKIL